MLAKEAERRVPPLRKKLATLGQSRVPDPDAVEEARVEVHGLKGAALVIGQQQLGRLAERTEQLLASRTAEGTIDPDLADRLGEGMDAFQAGARAAADGEPEPPAVAEALEALP